MNEVVINFLKEKPVIIPKTFLHNYKKLNITEEEFVVLIVLINEENKIIYNPIYLSEESGIDKYKIMQILNDLSEKNMITIKVENDKSGKKEEYIYLDLLYSKLLSLIIDSKEEDSKEEMSDIYSLFEQELGRTISPMEVEIIKEWMHDGFSEELLKEALKEAIYNNARSLKYIDRILVNWRNKGIKTKNDVLKEKRNYRKNIKTIEPIYDYNWLEEE